MRTILKRQYFIMLIPALGLFFIFRFARELNFIKPGQFIVSSVLHSIIFILSAVTAIAGPLFLRTIFAHSMRDEQQVLKKKFLSFQKKILLISLITPYLAFISIVCDFPKFYTSAIALMALYAGYYYFPSQKRIDFDKKIFRVK